MPTTEAGDAAVALTAALVAADSVNPGLVTGASGERQAAELVANRLQAAGFDVALLAPPSDPRRVLALRILRDHHLDPAVAALGGQAERPRQRPREERRRGEQDGRGSHHFRMLPVTMAGCGACAPIGMRHPDVVEVRRRPGSP